MSKIYGATSFSLDSIIITNGKIQIEKVKKKRVRRAEVKGTLAVGRLQD